AEGPARRRVPADLAFDELVARPVPDAKTRADRSVGIEERQLAHAELVVRLELFLPVCLAIVVARDLHRDLRRAVLPRLPRRELMVGNGESHERIGRETALRLAAVPVNELIGPDRRVFGERELQDLVERGAELEVALALRHFFERWKEDRSRR